MGEQAELVSTVNIQRMDELYQIIDILNKTLKHQGYIFGLSQHEEQWVFRIYQTQVNGSS
ncbi:YpmA family protein [Tuberibacillus sp. Marseille-P3662]|uniref:YpmA family protein n=1 Tax=Tuberibacillus sp. Marseille-P3662 TaxID=1965358 RepID=UPI000A1CCF59|nr:YpmA family protein [Tuberibacillus sp. Marseille-P3662]